MQYIVLLFAWKRSLHCHTVFPLPFTELVASIRICLAWCFMVAVTGGHIVCGAEYVHVEWMLVALSVYVLRYTVYNLQLHNFPINIFSGELSVQRTSFTIMIIIGISSAYDFNVNSSTKMHRNTIIYPSRIEMFHWRLLWHAIESVSDFTLTSARPHSILTLKQSQRDNVEFSISVVPLVVEHARARR